MELLVGFPATRIVYAEVNRSHLYDYSALVGPWRDAAIVVTFVPLLFPEKCLDDRVFAFLLNCFFIAHSEREVVGAL